MFIEKSNKKGKLIVWLGDVGHRTIIFGFVSGDFSLSTLVNDHQTTIWRFCSNDQKQI